MNNIRIQHGCSAGIFLLCFLFNSSNSLFAQGQKETKKQDVYKKDLANRLQILKEYDGIKNSKTPVLQRAALSYASQVSAEINGNGMLDEKKYNSLIQQTRLAYLDIVKRNINVPSNKLYVEVISPWRDFKTDLPDIKPGNKINSIGIKNIINGQQYAAFLVCNLDDAVQPLRLNFANQSSISQISFYDARFVLSRGYKNIPDALIPVKSATNIQPGEVKIFFVSIRGRKSGIERNKIQIRNQIGIAEIPLNIQTYPINLQPGEIGLNTINWAYYFYPMLKAKEKDATINLKDHFINSIVIPTGNLPAFQKPASTKEFDEYARRCVDYDNIILGLDLRRQSKSKDYLSSQWKTSFVQWYNFTLSRIKATGVNTADKKVYLYVMDEPTPDEISFTVTFIKWIKIAIPSAQLYATINNKQCTDALLPLLDVAQLYNRSLLSLDVKSNNMKKIWIYDTKSKALAPYQSFRLMAWEAFLKDYGGIGFWNYADLAKSTSSKESAWDDFDGNYADYNVIYDLDGKIINSRRWEAFKLGMEDYYILKLYAKKYGINAAKQLCMSVLKGTGNVDLADSVRNTLLLKLGTK